MYNGFAEEGKILYPRIRNLREDADLSQAVVAKLLNISQRGYSHYERGDNDIPSESLILLARFYHTSIDYLLGLTDDKNPYPTSKKFKHKEKA